MSDIVYELYAQARDLLSRFEKDTGVKRESEPNEVLKLVEGWQETIEVLEISRPDFKSTYERKKAVIDSFTYEQKDHICYQIGDWYIKWQDKMWVDGKPNQHWLGVAKEKLKTMICGD